MTEKILGEEDHGTFYATEAEKIPTIKCPKCGGTVTNLWTLLSTQKCESCGAELVFKVEY